MMFGLVTPSCCASALVATRIAADAISKADIGLFELTVIALLLREIWLPPFGPGRGAGDRVPAAMVPLNAQSPSGCAYAGYKYLVVRVCPADLAAR
jgi:hypothetical protein